MNRELISQYVTASQEFQKLIGAFAPSDLLKEPKPGEWSAGFVVHHMADAEVQFATRFMNALAEQSPQIVPFNEDIYPSSLNYSKRSVKASLDTCAAIAAFNVSLLENIKDEDWQRTSIHPDNGKMTISDLLTKVIGHCQSHIGQLREIKESL